VCLFAVTIASSIAFGCGDDSRSSPRPCPDVLFDTDIPVPAVSTTILRHERFSAHTVSARQSVQVDITDGRGTVSFGGRGPIPAFIYDRTPWADINQTLFAGLGVQDGTWYPFWLFCTPDGRLVELYGEMTDGSRTFKEYIDGTCSETVQTWQMPVEIPAHHLRSIAMTCGFEVSTPSWDVHLDLGSSRPGRVDLWGDSLKVLIFATIDCRNGCGGTGSWYELHSVMWDSVVGQVGFAIWYLDDPRIMGVQAANGVLLPFASRWETNYFPNAAWKLGR
jgi:hypothetical protein